MFKLPKQLSEMDIDIDKPFSIFEKNNFFDDMFYKKLHQEFPKEKYFYNRHKLGNKKYLNNKDDNFNIFLKESNSWSKFYYEINSKKFLNEIFLLCKNRLFLINERKKVKSIDFKLNANSNFLKRVIRKIKRFLGIYEVRLAFEFSLMKNGDFIPPHNDTENKLVSLMIYFPDETQKKEKDLGTNFYKSDKKNLNIWRGDMMDKEESDQFYQDHSVFYKSKFESNKIVGFIKCKNSWHDVSKIKSSTGIRKSLNINLYVI